MRVIDRAAEPSARFGYRVPFDDVQLTAGDVPLPDALTHQFFAFRGSILFDGFSPELFSFDASEPRTTVLPLWVTRHDIERAQDSSNEHTLGYDLSDITSQYVLDTMTMFEDRWLPITHEDARVPITFMQALRGTYWDVSSASPGLYTVAAYIFSPPYNGWEIRPGLVKLVADGQDPPAAVLSRIQEALFPGQGRRVRACLDVPADTELRAFMSLAEHPEQGWMPWSEPQPVASGDVELCFRPPRELQGSVRVRFDLSANGQTYSFYSPDMLTLLGGAVPCVESDSICCAAQEPSCPAADGGCEPTTTGATDASAADGGSDAHEKHARAERGGCSIRGLAAPGAQPWLLAAGAAWLAVRRRRSRLLQRHG